MFDCLGSELVLAALALVAQVLGLVLVLGCHTVPGNLSHTQRIDPSGTDQCTHPMIHQGMLPPTKTISAKRPSTRWQRQKKTCMIA